MKLIPLYKSNSLSIYSLQENKKKEQPFIGAISAGFPSPAADFIDNAIDLNLHLIKNPSSTFIAQVDGNSMEGAGINNKDLLIIDKSLKPQDGKIAICIIDGEFTMKRLKITKSDIWLIPENPQFSPKKITEFEDFHIWGMVTYSIQKHY